MIGVSFVVRNPVDLPWEFTTIPFDEETSTATGAIVAGTSRPLRGTLQVGFLDQRFGPSDFTWMPLESAATRVTITFDHEFFRTSDRLLFRFKTDIQELVSGTIEFQDIRWITDDDSPDPIPEPTTLALFGLGACAVGYARRRRMRR